VLKPQPLASLFDCLASVPIITRTQGCAVARYRVGIAASLCGVALLLQAVSGSPVWAQVSAGGLKTRVNGSLFGRCLVGRCAVQGGTGAGDRLFHRFGQFDTRDGIGEVRIDTAGYRHVFLMVANAEGAYLNSRLKLVEPGNLFLFSPRGLWLGPGVAFQGVSNLMLSTAVALDLPGGQLHVYNSTASDLAGLGSGLPFRFDDVAIPSGQSGVIGSQGGGALAIDRALLTIKGGLIVDATSGPLVLRQAQVSAADSLRLSGSRFELRDSRLSVGAPGKRGPIDLRAGGDRDSGSFGGGVIERVTLSGNQISISAGSLRLVDSHISAPKGWLEIQTTNPPGLPADLWISGSRIELNPREEADIWAPQILKRQLNDGSFRRENPTPHIGLFSQGDLKIDRSDLDASLLLPPSSSPDDATLQAALPLRAGIVFAEAAGRIELNQASLRADASHTLAGYLLMEAGRNVSGQERHGSLLVRDSKLSSSFGAGGGAIVLQADRGISVLNSQLGASSDRFPIVAGFTAPQGQVPAFRGGEITLYNTSETEPLLISASTLSATQHSFGGPFSSPFLSEPPDSRGYGSFGTSLDAWSLGPKYSFSGGLIQAYSTAGIRLERGSLLDVSSRDPASGLTENIAGSIALVNSGSNPIELHGSRLEARNGPARDPNDLQTRAGQIYIYGGGAIRLTDAWLDLTAANPAIPRDADLFIDPYLSLRAGQQIRVEGASAMLAGSAFRSSDQPQPPPMGSYGINLCDESVRLDPDSPDHIARMVAPGVISSGFMDTAVDKEETDNDLRSFEDVINDNRVVFERLYTDSPALLPAWSLPLSPDAPAALLPQTLSLQPSRTVASTPAPATMEGDAGEALLEAQQLALADTVASLGLPPGSGRVRSVADLQQRLTGASRSALASAGLKSAVAGASPAILSSDYRPAIVQLGLTELPAGQVQLSTIVLLASGNPLSHSQVLPAEQVQRTIRAFQRQVVRQESIDPAAADSPGATLAAWLLQPMAAALRSNGTNALLLAVDRGLQAIPYAALPFGDQLLGERFALSVSPSLGLLDLETNRAAASGSLLAAGASTFAQPLDPLPMVPRELAALAAEQGATVLLDEAFTAEALRQRALDGRFQRLHIATHADFQPGQNDGARLFTGRDSLNLAGLRTSLLSRSENRPLDLISLSACHTALGDEQSELGFVGMALQAGARSAIGTLWEVEDAATAGFFIQYYRYLQSGLKKDQALQATRTAFRRGMVRLMGHELVGPRVHTAGDSTLLTVNSDEQRRRLSMGLRHPHFWAGMVLTGSPW
jgi:CHAT domain-containing protein